MYVRYYMTPSPVTVGPEKSIEEAHRLLKNYHFRHLPVVDESGILLGMVTDRDLRSAYPSSILNEKERQKTLEHILQKPVKDIMSTDNVVLSPLSTLDDALLLFEKRRVGALPVVNSNGFVAGILSFNDLLKALRSLFGLGEKGSVLIAIEADESRSLSHLVKIMEEQKVLFTRLIRTGGSDEEPAMIYLRINTYNIRAVHKMIVEAGFKLHIPDPDPQE
ncbi:MAG: CBS domain-containing protein [Desulfobulbaceae bacterium]|nr:CBS domain-containing protein [Desulfobulbaceae bacterium]